MYKIVVRTMYRKTVRQTPTCSVQCANWLIVLATIYTTTKIEDTIRSDRTVLHRLLAWK